MLDGEYWFPNAMIAGRLTTIIFVALGAMHLYWALGGKAGKGSVIPTRDGEPVLCPGAIGTLLVAGALFIMATLLAIRSGWIAANPLFFLSGVATWLICALFGLRAVGDFRYIGFFKSVRDSRFARLDTLIYSPICVVLALLAGWAALS
jgi:hypothetical protein